MKSSCKKHIRHQIPLPLYASWTKFQIPIPLYATWCGSSYSTAEREQEPRA